MAFIKGGGSEYFPIDGDKFLNNAKEIAYNLTQRGYSKNAIAAYIANFEVECTLNPNLGEIGVGNPGYGFPQWTNSAPPPSGRAYLESLLRQSGQGSEDASDGNVQLDRLEWESKRNWSWYNPPISSSWQDYGTINSSLSFDEFNHATDSPETLSLTFVYAYLRPNYAVAQIPRRMSRARHFFEQDWIGGGEGGGEVCYDKPIKDTNIDRSSFMSEQLFGASATRPGGFHNGLDFGSIDHPGSEMVALMNGTVTHTGFMQGLRAYIVISNGEYNVVYQEFSYDVGNIRKKVGDKVSIGDVLAIRDADHLHLGFTKKDFMEALGSSFTDDGTWEDPLNFLGKCVGGNPNPPNPPPDKKKRTSYTTKCIRKVFSYDYL